MSPPIPRNGAPSSQPFSTEEYFQTQRPPAGLEEKTEKMRAFVAKWKAVEGKRVVLVTSGGTTVPLESNTVRFLDNFSAGTRGATSAEYFLSSGYAVIFMHRLHSLRPFSRHYSHSLNPFLDLLSVVPSSDPSAAAAPSSPPATLGQAGKESIVVDPTQALALLPILKAYHAAQSEGSLLSIEFQTVNEYLWLLKAVTGVMAPLGRRGMFYMAAAVSDFFLPEERMAEHKIQSGHGTLSLEMDQVPKVLRPLVQEWTPEGYIVSFKLETEMSLLIPKSRAALSRYGHQLVIGNDLHHRKYQVVFVERLSPSSSSRQPISGITDEDFSTPRKGTGDPALKGVETPPLPDGDVKGGSDEFRETWLRLDGREGPKSREGEVEIEELIVKELVGRHQKWIEAGKRR